MLRSLSSGPKLTSGKEPTSKL